MIVEGRGPELDPIRTTVRGTSVGCALRGARHRAIEPERGTAPRISDGDDDIRDEKLGGIADAPPDDPVDVVRGALQ
jgi:hypothetical protein